MDFKDANKFIEWLSGQDLQVCTAIETRASLRAWPVMLGSRFWKDTEEVRAGRERLTLTTGWCLLAASVCAVRPSDAIRSAADLAAAAAAAELKVVKSGFAPSRYGKDALDAAARSPKETADAAAASRKRTVYGASFRLSVGAISYAVATVTEERVRKEFGDAFANDSRIPKDEGGRAGEVASIAAYRDCDFMSEEMMRQPLWHGEPVPEGNRAQDLGATIFDTDPRFAFFARWYGGMVRGEPLPWELQEKVALIPEETWKAGVDAVAAAVEKSEREWTGDKPSEPAELSQVTEKEISVVTQRVTVNRDALAVTVASLLDQLDSFRDRVRGVNTLDPDVRDKLLAFIDGFRSQLGELLSDLPAPGEDVEEVRARRLVQWLREYRGVLKTKLVQYTSPENLGEATVPTAIILGATGVGAMMGAPLAGAAVGGLIGNQMKPSDAVKVLLKPDPVEDSNAGQEGD